jgi:hypothetical protein
VLKDIHGIGGNRSQKITKSIELDVIIADSDSDLEYKKRIWKEVLVWLIRYSNMALLESLIK